MSARVGLVAAATLAAGMASTVPASASGGHDVTVTVDSATSGWTAFLDCAPDGGGARFQRQLPMTPQTVLGSVMPPTLITFQKAVISSVANATCDVEAVSPSLLNVGGIASASATGLHVTNDVTSALHASTFSCSPGSLTGQPVAGQRLTAGSPGCTGGLVDSSALTTTWYRSGVVAPVGTGTGYTTTAADVGHRLTAVQQSRLRIPGPLPGLTGSAGTVSTSSSTAIVGGTTPQPAAAPAIQGRPVVGHVLTAAPGAAPEGARIIGYQWFVRRVVRGHERVVLVRIKHGHHRSLRMKERLAGKHVLVAVTYELVGSRPTTVYSQAVKVMKERMKE